MFQTHHRIPLVRWSLNKYKCLCSVRGKGRDSSLQKKTSHTYTLRLCYSRILSYIKKKVSDTKNFIIIIFFKFYEVTCYNMCIITLHATTVDIMFIVNQSQLITSVIMKKLWNLLCFRLIVTRTLIYMNMHNALCHTISIHLTIFHTQL